MEISLPESAAGLLSPQMLTPRSKVAKILADIDNAPTPTHPLALPHVVPSDEFRSSDTDSRLAHKDGTKTIQPRNVVRQNNGPFLPDSMAFDDSDSDDAVRRPQGRAARRMRDECQSAATDEIRETSVLPSSSVGEDSLYSSTPLKHQRHVSRLPTDSPACSISGGLFVSPARLHDGSNDDELLENPIGGKEKLAELETRKCGERLRREADKMEQRKRRMTERKRQDGSPIRKKGKQHRESIERPEPSAHASSDLPLDVSEIAQQDVNQDIERIMSDAAMPTRKATKKALMEMERETQRLARQQALAHQMKVKKKFTTSDLLSRFNQSRVNVVQPESTESVERLNAGPSSAPHSDGADSTGIEPTSTPPSSPPTAGPTPLQKQEAFVEQGALSKLVPVREDSITKIARAINADDDLPKITGILSASRVSKPGESKSFKIAAATEGSCRSEGFKLARLAQNTSLEQMDESDDEDLEILAPLPPHLKVFERAATRPVTKAGIDNKVFSTLCHLSRMGAYEAMPQKGNKPSRPSIGPKALEMQLRKKAKDQARQQQLERIAELKAKGIDVQTAEEREIEVEMFENLLEKARLEAQKLRKVEMAIAQEEGDDDDKAIEISDDEDEDYDYEASGSEEELRDEADEEDDEDNELVQAADERNREGSDDDEMQSDDAEVDENPASGYSPAIEPKTIQAAQNNSLKTPAPLSRKLRQSHIIVDDDDEMEQDFVHELPVNCARAVEDPFAAFNFDANNMSDTLLSPTQAFQATMQTLTQATQEESFDILRRIAPPSVSSLPPTIPDMFDIYTQQRENDGNQSSCVPGSQVRESQRMSLNWEPQLPETPVPVSLHREASALNETPGWEPTQDGGLPSPWMMGLRRESTFEVMNEQHETQETVPLRVSESPAPSNAPPKRGKLVRRQALVIPDDSEGEMPTVSDRDPKRDAFKEMARRRAAVLTTADREEVDKEMKRMMDEQAEESEDEYAGLGGDDFVAPETEEDKAMIDSSHIDVDELALAAHFAERERIKNEEETNRLYKDLTTGALRRKQANAWGLEEDEYEIALQRRQMRQQEEARKRKLLLQDDNIASLAQGKQSKGKDAFLKAIADYDSDDLLNLYDAGENDSQQLPIDDSQNSEIIIAETDLGEVSCSKRRLAEDEAYLADRPVAKQRRTRLSAFKKPASMLEVRESVSFLLEEPDAQLVGPSVDLKSDSEDDPSENDNGLVEDGRDDHEAEEDARQNDGGYAPNPAIFDAKIMPPPRLPAYQRRTAPRTAVVDRLSLRRSASGSSTRDLGRTAWAAPISGEGKVPSLLRRVTTNMTYAAGDRGVSMPNLGRENSGGVKKGGSKNSSLAYQARAEERRAIVEASARRREENTARIAQMRRNSSALGRGLTGRFE